MAADEIKRAEGFHCADRREVVSEVVSSMASSERNGFDIAQGVEKARLNIRKVRVLLPGESHGVMLAALDFVRYLRLSVPGLDVADPQEFSGEQTPRQETAEAVFIVGNPASDAAISAIYKSRNTPLPRIPNGALSIETFADQAGAIVILAGESELSQQHALYFYAERVLGVRYPTPADEIIPRWSDLLLPIWSTTERPLFSQRMISYWEVNPLRFKDGHIVDPLEATENGYGSLVPEEGFPLQNSPLYWLYQGVECGKPDMMMAAADWVPKVRSNMISWFHEWRQEVIRMPKEYIQREATRGIGVMNWISAGTGYGMQLYAEDEKKNLCCIDSITGALKGCICIETDFFWKNLDEHIEQFLNEENLQRNLQLFTLVLGEEWCARRAGHCGCTRCGHISNVEKSHRVIEYLAGKLSDRGESIKIGINQQVTNDMAPTGTRYQWVIDTVRDHPPDGVIAYRPAGDHWYHEFGGLLAEIDRRNRTEGTRISALLMGEIHLMMGSDLPLVTPIYFPALENRVSGIQSYGCTTGIDVDHFSFATLEWLKSRYLFANSWESGERDWRKFLRTEFSHLFGKTAGKELLQAMEALMRVEMRELVWENTPFNKDSASWKGALTNIFNYFTHFFNDFEYIPPVDLFVEKELWDANRTVIMGMSKRCTYADFLDHGWKEKQAELAHYDSLLEQYRECLEAAELAVTRNREYYLSEFARPLHQTYLFLKSQMLLAQAGCIFTEAEYTIMRHSLLTDFVRLTDDALDHLDRGIAMARDYYETRPFSDWSAKLPDVEMFEENRVWWKEYRDAVNQYASTSETCFEVVKKFHRHEFPKGYANLPGRWLPPPELYSFLESTGGLQ